jgi:hypothetical protein
MKCCVFESLLTGDKEDEQEKKVILFPPVLLLKTEVRQLRQPGGIGPRITRMHTD